MTRSTAQRASGASRGAMAATPAGLVLIVMYRIWPQELGSLSIDMQNVIAVGVISFTGYIAGVFIEWGRDMRQEHPNNLLYRLLGGPD